MPKCAFVLSRAEEGDKETPRLVGMSASASASASVSVNVVNLRCDCGVAIVAMRVWIAMPLLPRSLFSMVQEPIVRSRARRARDTRLERGRGAAYGGGRSRTSRDCKGSRQYPDQDSSSGIQNFRVLQGPTLAGCG
jgi:hypothetical protein